MEEIGGPRVNAAHTQVGWNFIVLMSRQGKIRLSEFFQSYTESEKRRILRDIAADILPRAPKMCNIIEKGPYKFVYRRYASLYFVVGVPLGMNELIILEQIHLFVEALDGYFNSGTFTTNERDLGTRCQWYWRVLEGLKGCRFPSRRPFFLFLL